MDTRQEAILQAVVLADPFEHQSRYGPLVRGGNKVGEGGSGAQPWCLLPLLNVPILAWTLECLSASGVKNCFIVIKEGAREVQEWLDSSTFTSPTATMTIRIRSTMAGTEGDVIREVDGLALTGDYLLVRAGFVGNLDLEKAVEDFTARRKKDPGLLMECLVSPRSNGLSSRSSTHFMSPSNQLLHYTNQPRYPRRHRSRFPLELFETCKELSIRTDLESVGVEICNMEVPALFVENFDYQSLRPDFINGVLTSDLLGKTISASVIGSAKSAQGAAGSLASRAQPWAAYLGDLRSYHQVSKAILSRWSYPLVPDEMLPGSHDRYEQRRGRLYVGKNLNLARNCILGSAALIGDRVSIGEHSSVQRSVLGQDVRIGANVVVKDSYVFEGASVEDGCTISDSIIAEGVHIKEGAVVMAGSLIGPGVVIGEQARLHGCRVSSEPYGDEQTPRQGSSDAEASTLGNGNQAYIWPSEETALGEDEDSEDEDALDPRNLRISSFYAASAEDEYASDASSISTISRSSSSSSLSDSAASEGSDASSAIGSDSSEPPAIAGISALDDSEASEDAAFLKECVSSLDRSFSEGHTVDNASIELKTLRMASNVQLKQVIGVVIPYLCDQAKVSPDAPAASVGGAVSSLVERWGQLVTNLTGGQESGMVDALLALQLHCATQAESVHPRLFPAFLQAYYEEDVVSEEAVVSWVKNPAARRTGGEPGMKLWQTGATFAKALMEAESSDDDESE